MMMSRDDDSGGGGGVGPSVAASTVGTATAATTGGGGGGGGGFPVLPRLHLNLSIPRQPTIQATSEGLGLGLGSQMPPSPQPRAPLLPPLFAGPMAPSEKEKTRNLIQSDILNTIAFGKTDAMSMAAANQAAIAAATAAGTLPTVGGSMAVTATGGTAINGSALGGANGSAPAAGTDAKRRSRDGAMDATASNGAGNSGLAVSIAGNGGGGTAATNPSAPNAGAGGAASHTLSSGVMSAAGGSVLAYFTRQSSSISVTTVRDLGRFDRLRGSAENISRLRVWFNQTYDPAIASFSATTATDLGVNFALPATPNPTTGAGGAGAGAGGAHSNPAHGRLLARTESSANVLHPKKGTLAITVPAPASALAHAPPSPAVNAPNAATSAQQLWAAQQAAGLALLDPTAALGWGVATGTASGMPLMDAYQFVVLMSKATHCSEYQLLQLFELFESRVVSVASQNAYYNDVSSGNSSPQHQHHSHHHTHGGGGGGGGFNYANPTSPSHANANASTNSNGPTSTGLGGLVFDDWFLVLLLFVAADCFQAHTFFTLYWNEIWDVLRTAERDDRNKHSTRASTTASSGAGMSSGGVSGAGAYNAWGEDDGFSGGGGGNGLVHYQSRRQPPASPQHQPIEPPLLPWQPPVFSHALASGAASGSGVNGSPPQSPINSNGLAIGDPSIDPTVALLGGGGGGVNNMNRRRSSAATSGAAASRMLQVPNGSNAGSTIGASALGGSRNSMNGRLSQTMNHVPLALTPQQQQQQLALAAAAAAAKIEAAAAAAAADAESLHWDVAFSLARLLGITEDAILLAHARVEAKESKNAMIARGKALDPKLPRPPSLDDLNEYENGAGGGGATGLPAGRRRAMMSSAYISKKLCRAMYIQLFWDWDRWRSGTTTLLTNPHAKEILDQLECGCCPSLTCCGTFFTHPYGAWIGADRWGTAYWTLCCVNTGDAFMQDQPPPKPKPSASAASAAAAARARSSTPVAGAAGKKSGIGSTAPAAGSNCTIM